MSVFRWRAGREPAVRGLPPFVFRRQVFFKTARGARSEMQVRAMQLMSDACQTLMRHGRAVHHLQLISSPDRGPLKRIESFDANSMPPGYQARGPEAELLAAGPVP